MSNPPDLRLHDLAQGTHPGLSAIQGAALAEAAAVCLEHVKHDPGVTLQVHGLARREYRVQWDRVSEQSRRTWADLQEATEYGASAIAALLAADMLGLCILSRSKKRTGFDYWLGPRTGVSALFQETSRLEVSGILDGSPTDVRTRTREKLVQIGRVPSPLVGHVVVVEFGAPVSEVSRT